MTVSSSSFYFGVGNKFKAADQRATAYCFYNETVNPWRNLLAISYEYNYKKKISIHWGTETLLYYNPAENVRK